MTDVLRGKVVRSPDAALVDMLYYQSDIWPSLSAPMDSIDLLDDINGLVRTGDIETLHDSGFLVTQDSGFHVGYIAYNIRDTATINTIRTTYRGLPAVSYWPLHDVEFRHALIHSYDQLGIIPPMYGYAVSPVRSLVPPAQSYWYNPNTLEHPFNQGNPFTSPPGEHSTCGILKAAGYTFVDADSSTTVTDADYWECPDGSPLPYMEIWTPLMMDAPTSWAHGQEFVADLATVGLAATTANGNYGFEAFGRDFNEYLDDVYGTSDSPGGQFDAFMVFHDLGRLPDQLYSLCHSSQDSYTDWGQSNAPGINDAELDALLETTMFSLPPPPGWLDPRQTAAFEVQERMYNSSYNYALAYMMLYSRTQFNAFTPNLEGIVRSTGYGSANKWTFLNMRWEPGTERLEDVDDDGDDETVIIYINHLPPDTLNPTGAKTVFEWSYMSNTIDGLTGVNPYSHMDIPWVALDWAITETPGGMEVDFTLRDDVYWQDGYQVSASDVEFALEFYRDWNTVNFGGSAAAINDVVVTDPTHCTIEATEASLSLFYDYAGSALLLPPQIWDRDWGTSANVLNYHPEDHAYGSDMAPGYAVGPWAEPADPDPKVVTNLFGTGPWIYQFYDETNEYADLWANRNYFITKADIQNMLVEMFHEVGDVNRDERIDILDEVEMMAAYGYSEGEPGYNPDADLNGDGIIDILDVLNGGGLIEHMGNYQTYPNSGGGNEETPLPSSQSKRGNWSTLSQPSIEESQQTTGPTMYIDPAHVLNETLQNNDLFSIDINIVNVTALAGFDFRLDFNSTILNVENVTSGDFFGNNPKIWKMNWSNVAGWVRYAATPPPGLGITASGSGVLATIEFRVKAYGSSSLEQEGKTKLSTSKGLNVVHSTLDGYFRNKYLGDIDGDWDCDYDDFLIFASAYLHSSGQPGYDIEADFDVDGDVDYDDFLVFAANYLKTFA